MSKRFLILAVLVTMVAALAACAQPKEAAPAPAKTATSPTSETGAKAEGTPPEYATGTPAFRVVYLKIVDDPPPSTNCKITAYDSTASMWMPSSQTTGPKRVMWMLLNPTPNHAVSITTTTGNKQHLQPPASIPCKTTPGEGFTKSGNAQPSSNAVDWDYTVTAWRCVNGMTNITPCGSTAGDPKIVIYP